MNEPQTPAQSAGQATSDQATSKATMDMVTAVQRLRDEIGNAVVGQREVIDQVLIAMLAAGHVLIEGVPGLGKTLLVRALAKTFGGNFSRIQFTPDLMPSDVTGHAMFDQAKQKFVVRRGPVFANLLLADEINRAPAKTQAALLEVMQEYQVTIEGTPMALAQPFMTLATQNPIEQEGTYPLPEAQLDRFLLMVRIDYPQAEEETELVQMVTNGKVGERLNIDSVRQIIDPKTVIALQQQTARVEVDERIVDYAVRIARQTRQWSGIAIGAGPRGGISLIRSARGAAVLAGRDFVIPDDVKSMAVPTLRHRIALTPDLEMEGHTADSVLTDLLDKVDAPRS